MYICLTHSCLLLRVCVCVCVCVLLLIYSCFTALYIFNWWHSALLKCTIYKSCFTPALLLLLSLVCMCVRVCMYVCMYMYIYIIPALLLLDSILVWALQSKACQKHLALVLKGLRALEHFIAELKQIITPTKLLARPGVVSVSIQCLLLYINIYMVYLCFIPASRLLIYVTAVTLLHLHICIYTRALLVLYHYFSCCACVCACAGLLA
jgi:hypothetical protein